MRSVRDDSAKKCAQIVPSDETAAVHSFTTESYGVPITFVSPPRSPEAQLDFLAATIEARDLRTCAILVICEQSAEAQHVKSEMGMRNINTMLLDADHQMARHMVRLWSQGYIHQVLISCDDELNLLKEIPVNLVIHTSLPPVTMFKRRINNMTLSELQPEMLALTSGGPNKENNIPTSSEVKAAKLPAVSSGANEDSLNPDPMMDTSEKERTGKTPKLVVKPLMMSLEENLPSEVALGSSPKQEKVNSVNSPMMRFNRAMQAMFPKQALAQDDYPPFEGRPLSSSEMNEQAEAAGTSQAIGPFKDSLAEASSDSEGWATPPEFEIEHFEDLDRLPGKLEAISRASSPLMMMIMGQSAEEQGTPTAWEEDGITRAQFGVLAWSRDVFVPCSSIRGVPGLNSCIKETMTTLGIGDNQARSLQRFAWPHAASGKSLVVVGPEASGKTWSFLPSLCQRTNEQLRLRMDDNYGPTSIVVCSNKQEGKLILQLIIKLLDPLNGSPLARDPMVTLWEKANVQEAAVTLGRHTVGILVTTPDMLLQLMDWHSKKRFIFDSKSLKCLALDNLSRMMNLMPHTTQKVVNFVTQLADFSVDGCQLFATMRRWPKALSRTQLLRLVPDVLIVFKDPLEASAYAGGSLEINLIEAGEESRSVEQLLRGRTLTEERIVVVCNSQTDVLRLKNTLIESKIRCEPVFGPAGLSVVTTWRESSLPIVLLVTDEIVKKLHCGPVDLLIHHDPAENWTRFKFRFCLFYDNYASASGASNRNPGKSIVQLRQTDLEQLGMLCSFTMWHQQPRPQHLLAILAENRRLTNESNADLTKLSLCEHLTAYGDCLRPKCRYRHVMWQEEVHPPAYYPTEGEIHFQVLSCSSPAHLAVRLPDLYPTKVIYLNIPMTELGEKVHLHYEQEQNRHKHQNPQTGDIVIVRNLKRYDRVIITGVDDAARKITVRLLDSGVESLVYNPSQIFVCDQRFQNEPDQAMEVRLIGIEPDTLDRIWTNDVRESVRCRFFSRLHGGQSRVFSARVEHVLGRTIFVETVFDDEGRDLRSYLKSRFRVHNEEATKEKLLSVVREAKPKDQ